MRQNELVLGDGYSLIKGFIVLRRISIKTSLPNYYPNKTIPTATVEELDELVSKCTVDDVKRKQQIVELNLRLALGIASLNAAAYPRKRDDIAGVALLALVKAVKRFFEIEDHDLSICPYITRYVSGRLKDYLAEDCLIRTPARTYFSKIQESTIDSLNESVDTGIGKSDVLYLIQDIVTHLTPRRSESLAVRMNPDLDIREIMDIVLGNDEDKRILELKILGCSDKEITADLQSTFNRKRSVSFVQSKRTNLVHQIELLLT